jgi:hypothetical protein
MDVGLEIDVRKERVDMLCGAKVDERLGHIARRKNPVTPIQDRVARFAL